MKALSLIFLFLLPVQLIFSQYSGQDAINSISNGQCSILREFLKQGNNPDSLYGQMQIPLLHYAVSLGKIDAVKIILDAGADIERVFERETPLMIAVLFNQKAAVNLLLKYHASVNAHNNKGETAFILAAKENNVEMMKLLYENGADINIKDHDGKTAIDYAYQMQHIEAYNFLKDKTEDKYAKTVLPDYFDGPYVFLKNKNSLSINFFYNDSVKNKTYLDNYVKQFEKNHITIENKKLPFTVNIRKNPVKTQETYKNAEKIMAIGDLHGGFDELRIFLIGNKIVDKNLNWIWGKGHLVFAGDVFDRGNKVTECFWLIYNLEQQAELAGGKVHFVPGNHEIMELTGDKRYLADKYVHLCNRLNFDYSALYGNKTVLGRWLRSKNAVIVINDILFVHGGLSEEMVQKKISIQTINKTVKNILLRKNPEPVTGNEKLILGANGPLWYRGYLRLPESYYRKTGQKFDFDEKKLDEILNFYKVKTIIFANTHVSQIYPMYQGKLFGIDINFDSPGIKLEALLWENNHFYRVLIDGTKIKLH